MTLIINLFVYEVGIVKESTVTLSYHLCTECLVLAFSSLMRGSDFVLFGKLPGVPLANCVKLIGD